LSRYYQNRSDCCSKRMNSEARTGITVFLYQSGSPKWTSAAIGTKRYIENLKISRFGPAIVVVEVEERVELPRRGRNRGCLARL